LVTGQNLRNTVFDDERWMKTDHRLACNNGTKIRSFEFLNINADFGAIP